MIQPLRRYIVILLPVFFLLPAFDLPQLKKTHLSRADREQWNQVLKIPKDCEESFSNTMSEAGDYSGLEFYHISGREYLVFVECYPGAYQPGGVLYLLQERQTRNAKLLKLEGFDSEDRDGNALPYSVIDGLTFVDLKRASLEILSKSRGMGDCGRFMRYAYRQGRFLLVEFREQGCRLEGDPGSTDYHHWPVRKRP
jgi:Protein of unknown function (DUF1176)